MLIYCFLLPGTHVYGVILSNASMLNLTMTDRHFSLCGTKDNSCDFQFQSSGENVVTIEVSQF